MPGTVTLIMRDPKRAGNLPSDFFTLEWKQGQSFPQKKFPSPGPGRAAVTLGKSYTRGFAVQDFVRTSSHSKNVSLNNFLPRIVSAV